MSPYADTELELSLEELLEEREIFHRLTLAALEMARMWAGAGFCVLLSPRPAPTPFLSFAVGYLQAAAGVNITASHNPKEYNGCKIYGAEGTQVDEDFCRRMLSALSMA